MASLNGRVWVCCRRRNGRWNEEETSYLIRNVREHGKGKWKRILESGGSIFQNRSQVKRTITASSITCRPLVTRRALSGRTI